MQRLIMPFAGALFSAMIVIPVLAQSNNAPPSSTPSSALSPQCIREIVKLCRSDESEVRGCIKENFSSLSGECSAQIKARMDDDRAAENREKKRRERQAQRQASNVPSSPYNRAKVTRTLFYGSHPNQRVDVYAPKDAVDDLPVILFVHGGGWSMGDNKYVQGKPGYYTGSEYIFASTGYRLLPSSPVEDQARDVGAAVQAVVGQAGSIGADQTRIVLMGHSAGAHLAALVATDPQYAGDAFDAIKGAVLLDGAGYDVAERIKNAKARSLDLYLRVFGNEPARHAALSPVTHVGGRDAPNWLALYVKERSASRVQAQSLADALTAAGAQADAVPIAGTDHSRLSREIGTDAGAAQTEAVDAFLKRVLP